MRARLARQNLAMPVHFGNTPTRLHLFAESAASTIIKSIRHTAMTLSP